MAVSDTVRTFRGTPVDLYCDGGYVQGVGAVGFCIVASDGRVLRSVGDCHLGFSSNKCECYAVLCGLEYVVA